MTQKHWVICGFFPLSCPNHCEAVVQRGAMKQHISQDCPLAVVECEFEAVGCEVRLTRRDMPSHISTSLATHISLQQNWFLHLQKNVYVTMENLQTTVTAQEKTIHELLSTVAKQAKSIIAAEEHDFEYYYHYPGEGNC